MTVTETEEVPTTVTPPVVSPVAKLFSSFKDLFRAAEEPSKDAAATTEPKAAG